MHYGNSKTTDENSKKADMFAKYRKVRKRRKPTVKGSSK